MKLTVTEVFTLNDKFFFYTKYDWETFFQNEALYKENKWIKLLCGSTYNKKVY